MGKDDSVEPAKPTGGAEGEPPDSQHSRRETLRALLARDSAKEWLTLKGGSLASPPRAEKSRDEERLLRKRAPEPEEPAESPELPSEESDDTDHDAVRAALVDAWTDARQKLDCARTKRLKHRRLTQEKAAAQASEATPSEGDGGVKHAVGDAKHVVDAAKHAQAISATRPEAPLTSVPRAVAPKVIPKAARPAAPPLRPLSPPKASLRLLMLMALLAGLSLYLGVSKSRLQRRMNAQAVAVKKEHDLELRQVVTEREEANDRANEAAEARESLSGELRTETRLRAASERKVTEHQATLAQLEASLAARERDLELVSKAAGRERASARVAQATAAKASKAAEKRAKARLEGALREAASTRKQLEGELTAARAKASAREAELGGELEVAARVAERRTRELEDRLNQAKGDVERLEGLTQRELARSKAQEGALRLAEEREAEAKAAMERARRTLGGLERRVAEQEHALSSRQAGTPRVIAVDVMRLTPDGSLEKAGAPVVLSGEAAGAHLSLELGDLARAELERAARGEVLLAIHLLVRGRPPSPLVLSEGVVTLEGHTSVGLVRFWLTAASARALLVGSLRLTLSLGKAADEGAGAVLLRGARVVATPLSDDLRARLDQVERR